MDPLFIYVSCLPCFSCLFIAALYSPDLLYVMCFCVFVTFLGQVWNLIVSIPDLCILIYYN